MAYNNYLDSFKFPSGSSIKTCKRDAKKDKHSSLPYSKPLNVQGQKHMGNDSISWPRAIQQLKKNAVEAVYQSSKTISSEEAVELRCKHKRLTQYGVGLPSVIAKRHQFSKNPDTLSPEFLKSFEEEQNQLLFGSLPEINTAISFIRKLKPAQDLNERDNRDSLTLTYIAKKIFILTSDPC